MAEPATLELFPALVDVPPCTVCGTKGFKAGCWRCELRSRLFFPSAEELAERAALREASRARTEAARQTEGERSARLEQLGRPVRAFLVGCGKAKAAEPMPARELYRGSLFRAARAHAERAADEWFVLSAAHGIVRPDRVLAPYDVRLSGSVRLQRARWGERVVEDLLQHFPAVPVALTVLAGTGYARWLRPHIPPHWSVEEPLQGLGLGKRLAWFKASSRVTRGAVKTNLAPGWLGRL